MATHLGIGAREGVARRALLEDVVRDEERRDHRVDERSGPSGIGRVLGQRGERGIARLTLSAFWASTADTDLRLSNNVVSCGLLVERNWLSFWLSAAVPSSRDLITARRCSSTLRTMSACPTRSKS